MIFYRYLALQIFKASFMVLFILIAITLFLDFVHQMKDLGKGLYGFSELLQYLLLRTPLNLVDYMPVAAVIGTTLSLGHLASSSELIAFLSAGVSLKKFIRAVAMAAMVLALISMALTDFVVPYSETRAKEFESSNMMSRVSMHSRKGVWIKDESNIVFIGTLFPNGNARQIRIDQLDEAGNLVSSLSANKAIMDETGWLLSKVKITEITDSGITVSNQKELHYSGRLTQQLLETLTVQPRAMSISDLYTYVQFLQDNGLDYSAESLMMWRKIYTPLSIVILALLALPFVMGSQRHGSPGQRVLIGLFLGISYVVLNSILIQLGEQLGIIPFINALIPILVLASVLYLLFRTKIMPT